MRALLSVADRDGIASFARRLQALGVEIVATDGTREALAADGVEVGSVSDLTQVPPLVGGQVKTFHPAVYAGILARRDVPEQLAELEAQGIGTIDIVAVNVKPFAPAVGARLVAIDEAIEMIDVGGAALLGAAARNAAGVTAVSSPDQYDLVTDEIRERGMVSAETRARLAAEAFSTVAAYHAEIAAYLNQITGNQFPRRLALVLEKVDDLRYGENPHQHAAFYRETTHRSGTLADAAQLQGGRPSFNNLLDLDAAYRIARDYTSPTVAIVKHTDPVGLASHDELVEASVTPWRPIQWPRSVASSRSTASSTARRPGRSRPTRTRPSWPRRSAPRPSACSGPRPAWRSWPCRPTRPRACATTASPTWTSSASPAGCWWRAWMTWGWTAVIFRS